MSKVIATDISKCVGCNKCIMVCPIRFANNVVIVDGERKIKINDSRCISCGKCIHTCDHGARDYIDDSERFFDDLKKIKSNGEKITLIVAPSFVANQYDIYKNIFGYLKSLGINLIYDVSFGADITSWTYVKYLENKSSDYYISQPCPPVVNYIEKYAPNLIKKLIPAQSPAIDTAIYLKKYVGINDKIAFLSPCLSKKEEFEKELNRGYIDYSLTFENLFDHMKSENIDPTTFPESDFDNIKSGLGVTFSRPGGLKNILLYHLPKLRIKQIEGQGKIYEYLKYLSIGYTLGGYDLVDILNCEHGCNVGTAACKETCDVPIDQDFHNEVLSDKRLKNQNKRDVDFEEYDKLFKFFDETLNLADFSANYQDLSELTNIPAISEEDIEKAFGILKKNDADSKKINCYSCGYRTCKDMAIAICNGYNEPSSCYQYNKHELEAQKSSLQEQETYIRTILEHLTESIIVTDKLGQIEFVNKEAQSLFNHPNNEYLKKHIKFFIPDINIEEITEGSKYDFQNRDENGNVIYLEIECNSIEINNNRLLVFIISDITKDKELSDLKNQFISMVSHELRTPLTSIRGALGLISGGKLGEVPEKVKGLINIAGNNSIRLVNLINDILDMEKIKAGKMDFIFTEYEIMPLVEETVNFNQSYAKQHNVEYKIVKRLDDALANIDKDRFVQVLTNLLSNAAKFSTPNETVEISVEKINCSIRISVTNKGSGIPESAHSKIFESFSQVDSTDSRSKGGSGLGLNISKSLIQKMGGNINFKSTPNETTTFYFDLPEIQTGQTKEKVLICEDCESTAFCIKKMFEKIGYNVDIAHNAKEAQELLKNNDYKLMSLDILLPDKDGLSLLAEIRQENHTKHLPVIIISARKKDEHPLINEHEIVAWLEKSFDINDLEKSINALMKKQNKNKVKILHVEHDRDILEIISSTLKDSAHMTTAETLADAEALLKKNFFDIIILDYRFPNGVCDNLIHYIKNSHNKHANLIIFSAYELKSTILEQVDLAIFKTKVSNEQFLQQLKPYINQKLQTIRSR